jgi:hypothetical protein
MNGHSWTPDRRADLARREAERRATTPRLEVEAHSHAGAAPGGWAVLPAWVACDHHLSPEARCLLLILSSHADDRTHPFPSIARMARFLGRSERTVLRVLADLEAAGLVQRVHRYRGGEQVSSAYVLRFDRWGRDSRPPGGVSPVTYRGDTDDTPRGDTDDTPRGDTGVAQTKTTRPPPKEEDSTPPYPPAGAGGPDEDREQRGERIRRIAREQGVRVRDARRMVEREEALAASPPTPNPAGWEDAIDDLEAVRAAYAREYGGST